MIFENRAKAGFEKHLFQQLTGVFKEPFEVVETEKKQKKLSRDIYSICKALQRF